MSNLKLGYLTLAANIAALILAILWAIDAQSEEAVIAIIFSALGAIKTLYDLVKASAEIGPPLISLLEGASFAVIAFLIFIIVNIGLQGRINKCLEQIFVNAPRSLHITDYSSNGEARVRETCDERPIDGENDYLTITLQVYQDDAESGVILLLRNFRAEQFASLSFSIRGEHGGERIGLKMKNTEGREVTVWVSDMEEKQVTPHWQEVRIASDQFLGVSRYPLENITFFIKGEIVGTETQTFYITRIRFD